MPFLNAMAIFCEDIREEKNDIITLIGLLPDTVELESPSQPAPDNSVAVLVNKLCVFVRINFDPDMELSVSGLRLVLPEGEIISMGQFDPDLITKAKTDSKAKGNPIAGIIFRAVMSGFRPPIGPIRVEAEINSETHLLSALMFKRKEA